MYLLGYDSGTSSIKATLMDAQTGKVVAAAMAPSEEMSIESPNPGWAQQDPALWWENLKAATGKVLTASGVKPAEIKAIGISYQMHGLVCVDKDMEVIRPSIIWCDSRAVAMGEAAADKLGKDRCLGELLNYPGNFTASKLRWVIENEPENFKRTYKIMLPGDWLAMKMTGRAATTETGLSEMILWDFKTQTPAAFLMETYGFSMDIIPEIVPAFGNQGELTAAAATELGLAAGTPVTYRAGDQPNNAMSLNVFNPGEVAATAGTSGVVYGISDTTACDPQSRVNVFLHVNNKKEALRNGVLLCVNGTGRLNSWLRSNVATGLKYEEMNELAEKVPVGSQGLSILPFGNGSERTLGNKNIGASFHNLDLNTHGRGHILRASQEGIVFALNYGMDIMRQMGMSVNTVRAGKANMFLSPIFSQTFASLTGAKVELYDTDGAQGACRGAGIGAGIYASEKEAFATLNKVGEILPETDKQQVYAEAYQRWLDILNNLL